MKALSFFKQKERKELLPQGRHSKALVVVRCQQNKKAGTAYHMLLPPEADSATIGER
mgnify:CR=1 FL=1